MFRPTSARRSQSSRTAEVVDDRILGEPDQAPWRLRCGDHPLLPQGGEEHDDRDDPAMPTMVRSRRQRGRHETGRPAHPRSPTPRGVRNQAVGTWCLVEWRPGGARSSRLVGPRQATAAARASVMNWFRTDPCAHGCAGQVMQRRGIRSSRRSRCGSSPTSARGSHDSPRRAVSLGHGGLDPHRALRRSCRERVGHAAPRPRPSTVWPCPRRPARA